MGFYIDQNGSYYEGDKAHWQDQDVPPRPSNQHTWDGISWVIDPQKVNADIDAQIRVLEANGTKDINMFRGFRRFMIWAIINEFKKLPEGQAIIDSYGGLPDGKRLVEAAIVLKLITPKNSDDTDSETYSPSFAMAWEFDQQIAALQRQKT